MEANRVITGIVRMSYAHVFEPYQGDGEDKAKYSVQLIIKKSDTKTIAKINEAIKEALTLGKDKKFGGKIPKVFMNPLRDGDEEREDDENYAGCYFLTAKTTDKPSVVDRDVNPIMDKSQFYSGCYGVASISFFAYNVKNAGVGVALNSVMKVRDGEALGAKRISVEDDFADLSFDDESFD